MFHVAHEQSKYIIIIKKQFFLDAKIGRATESEEESVCYMCSTLGKKEALGKRQHKGKRSKSRKSSSPYQLIRILYLLICLRFPSFSQNPKAKRAGVGIWGGCWNSAPFCCFRLLPVPRLSLTPKHGRWSCTAGLPRRRPWLLPTTALHLFIILLHPPGAPSPCGMHRTQAKVALACFWVHWVH